VTFKQRVHKELIAGAAIYKAVFVDYEYLVFSKEFNNKPYYITGIVYTDINRHVLTARERDFYNGRH